MYPQYWFFTIICRSCVQISELMNRIIMSSSTIIWKKWKRLKSVEISFRYEWKNMTKISCCICLQRELPVQSLKMRLFKRKMNSSHSRIHFTPSNIFSFFLPVKYSVADSLNEQTISNWNGFQFPIMTDYQIYRMVV